MSQIKKDGKEVSVVEGERSEGGWATTDKYQRQLMNTNYRPFSLQACSKYTKTQQVF